MLSSTLLALASALALFSSSASAGGGSETCFGNADNALYFNGLFETFFTSGNSDLQGRLGAGNRIEISGGYSVGEDIYSPDIVCSWVMAFKSGIEKYSVISGGSVKFLGSGGSIKNGGVAYGTNVNLNDAITQQFKNDLCRSDKTTSLLDFTTEIANLQDLTDGLLALSNTGRVETTGNTVLRFGGSSGVEVFSLTPSQVSSIAGLSFAGTPSSSLSAIVINVNSNSKTGVTLQNFGMSDLGRYRRKVIWNFGPKINSLTIQSISVEGMILAPYTPIVGNNGNINGNMYGKSFDGTLEFHNTGFDGCLSPPKTTTTTTTETTTTTTTTTKPTEEADHYFHYNNHD
ncbi:hypothetical protein BJ742DRAFT_281067 [Cladochytrium replicatum]|nr:hypothetical protein BJ742DRAFT_281067 [Cladochytrium replicatum]